MYFGGARDSVNGKKSELDENDLFDFWKKHKIDHYGSVVTADNVQDVIEGGFIVNRVGLYHTRYERPENEKQRVNHWCCVSMPNKNYVAFFDPYGQNPLANGSYETPLSSLVVDDDAPKGRRGAGIKVYFSHGDCQAPGTSVCGEYCALFGYNGFDLSSFYNTYQLHPIDTLRDGEHEAISDWALASINTPTRVVGNQDGSERYDQLANDRKILSAYNALK
jgi:hypothetical protein